MPERFKLFAAWLLGFFLVANVYLLPSIKEVRATDALGAMLGLWLLWRFATRGLRIVPLVALFACSVTPLFWGILAFFADDTLTTSQSVRWLLAAPWGYALFIIARNPQHRVSLVWGLWWGCAANAVVLLLQFYGLVQLTKDIGLAAQQSALTTIGDLNNVARAPGMHGHPNPSTAILSLIVPLSLYLYYTRNARIWTMVVGLGVLLAATEFTLTRSALLVSLITILASSISNRDLKPSLRLGGLLMLGGLPALYWIGPPGGWQRWLDPGNVQTNWSARLSSDVAALRISLEHPLGLGSEAGHQALRSAGFVTTHNAFLQAAIVYGMLLAVILASLMLILALQTLVGSRTTWRLEALLAFHLFVLFLWEEYFNIPSFIILASWLVAASVVQISSSLKRGGPAWIPSVRQHSSAKLLSSRPASYQSTAPYAKLRRSSG